MNCARYPIAFAGFGSFNSLLEKVQGATLIKPASTNNFTDATFIDTARWQTLISAVAGMEALPLSIKRGYENSTPDLQIETSNIGFAEVTDNPLPSMIGYIDGSYCDYKTVQALHGQSFNVVLHLKGGAQFSTRNAALAIKGFRATIFTRLNIPLADDRQKSYPVYISFESIEEFVDGYVDTPDYSFQTLLDYRPIGLDMKIITAYAASVVVVKVTNRSDGTPQLSLAAADFTILASNADDVTVVSLVDDLTGQYSLTVQKDSAGVPTILAAGEWATVQVTEDDASNYTHAGNQIRVKA